MPSQNEDVADLNAILAEFGLQVVVEEEAQQPQAGEGDANGQPGPAIDPEEMD